MSTYSLFLFFFPPQLVLVLADVPRLLAKGTSFDGFSWGLRAAGQTIGEVAIGMDLGMLDK